jgi:hypothetical protein
VSPIFSVPVDRYMLHSFHIRNNEIIIFLFAVFAKTYVGTLRSSLHHMLSNMQTPSSRVSVTSYMWHWSFFLCVLCVSLFSFFHVLRFIVLSIFLIYFFLYSPLLSLLYSPGHHLTPHSPGHRTCFRCFPWTFLLVSFHSIINPINAN